jgi:phosphatidate phosphatase PAH1
VITTYNNVGLPSSRDFIPIASNQGVRMSISKTARLHGEEEEEENKESE